MCSVPRDWERPVADSSRLFGWKPRPATHAVWVRLDTLFPRDNTIRGQAVIDGLELSGNVRGILLGWKRGASGQWLGVVNYAVHYADGRRQTAIWNEQLVPAAAISPREDNHPLGGC